MPLPFMSLIDLLAALLLYWQRMHQQSLLLEQYHTLICQAFNLND